VSTMKVICDRHDTEMIYDQPLFTYRCPAGQCPARLGDEDIRRLSERPDVSIPEIRVTTSDESCLGHA
jgi:hypothetical protein